MQNSQGIGPPVKRRSFVEQTITSWFDFFLDQGSVDQQQRKISLAWR